MGSTSQSSPETPLPGEPTVWVWRVGMARRHWSPLSRWSTIFPSCALPRGRGTISLSISGWTAAIPAQSVYAFRDAFERRVDYATVNGRFFVNNVSLGVYATIVQQEGYREAKSATTKQLLPELLGETERPFDLQFTSPDGAEVDGSFLVMVSNNPYVLAASPSTSQRLRLDTGRLGVFAVTAATGTQAAEVVDPGPGRPGAAQWPCL